MYCIPDCLVKYVGNYIVILLLIKTMPVDVYFSCHGFETAKTKLKDKTDPNHQREYLVVIGKETKFLYC
jgi:hypothetical protein